MGVLGFIAQKKAQFQDATVERRKKVILKKTAKLQEANVREGTVLEAKQKLQEAEQINKDLREAQGPSKLQNLGKGIKRTIEKGKQARSKFRASAPPSSGSRGLGMGGTPGGSVFGGQRDIDVGGKSGGGFSFGPSPKTKPEKKREGTTITIQTR